MSTEKKSYLSGTTLRYAREMCGLSIDDMYRAGFKKFELWQEELRMPSAQELWRLGQFLRTPVGWFFLTSKQVEQDEFFGFSMTFGPSLYKKGLDVYGQCWPRKTN